MKRSIYRIYMTAAALALIGPGNTWAEEVKPTIISPEKKEQKILVGLKLEIIPAVGAKPFTKNINFEVYKKRGDENSLNVDIKYLENGTAHIKNLKPGKYYVKARHTEAWPWPGIDTGSYVEVKEGKLGYYVFNMNLGKIAVQNKVTDSNDTSSAKVVAVTMYSSDGKKIGNFRGVNRDIWVRPGKYKITATFGYKEKRNTGVFEVKANDNISQTFTFTTAGLRVSATDGKDRKPLEHILYRVFSVVNNKKDHLIWGCAENFHGNLLNCWEKSKSLRQSTLVVHPGTYILTAEHENGGFMKTTVAVRKNETKAHVFNFSLGTLSFTLPKGTHGRIFSTTNKKMEYVSVGEGVGKELLTPGQYRIVVKKGREDKVQQTMEFKISKNKSTNIKIVLNK